MKQTPSALHIRGDRCRLESYATARKMILRRKLMVSPAFKWL